MAPSIVGLGTDRICEIICTPRDGGLAWSLVISSDYVHNRMVLSVNACLQQLTSGLPVTRGARGPAHLQHSLPLDASPAVVCSKRVNGATCLGLWGCPCSQSSDYSSPRWQRMV